MGIQMLVYFGIMIQFIFLSTIFDIYFTSPIVSNIEPIKNDLPTIAQRVVVISVDGLRSDALLENNPLSGVPNAPYIRWSIDHRGTWGVSLSHLPTESRPGHVAMLAGFYEDPSAVTKGWKENPVDFDSIFNKSVCSFAWGSPDIVNIFYKELKHNCSFKYVYGEDQDFSGNTMELDNWVLTHLNQFFRSAGDPLLYTRTGSLFFLHLLGQDTSGHTHKPNTDLYRENLRNVDRIVKEVDFLFSQIFRDNGTAFVLTADHGMTDWGSHGAGDPSEIITPVVAWGSGIRNNNETAKVEINQADITPLLAILLGVSIPVNSIGILPSQFLNASKVFVAKANFINAQQISQLYLAKRAELEIKPSFLLYKEYADLNAAQVAKIQHSIAALIQLNRYEEADQSSRQLVDLSLKGIIFYQHYFQRPLFFLATISYLSWILYLLLNLCDIEKTFQASSFECALVGSISLFVNFLVYFANLPYTYHAYFQLPVCLLWLVGRHISKLSSPMKNLLVFHRLFTMIAFLVGVELFVIGFFKRWILSISLFAIILWPVFSIKNSSKHFNLLVLWAISGVLLGVFTFLPVVGKQPHPLLILLASVLIFVFTSAHTLTQNQGRITPLTRSILVLASGLNSFYIHSSFSSHHELKERNKLISWLLLVSAVILLFKSSRKILENLQNAFSSLSIPFLLLSISHEGLFLFVFFVHLSCWVQLEIVMGDVISSGINYQQYTRMKLHNVLSVDDIRRAYFFLSYIYIAFFGIGNLATLNSFDPAWVRCLLTNFAPYTMTALILLKVIIPFFAVTLAVRVIILILNIRPYEMFICVLIYCNLMALNFLFMVKNEGSWLEIGISLSHYVIQQVTIVFLLVLYCAAQFVIPYNLKSGRNKSHFF